MCSREEDMHVFSRGGHTCVLTRRTYMCSHEEEDIHVSREEDIHVFSRGGHAWFHSFSSKRNCPYFQKT